MRYKPDRGRAECHRQVGLALIHLWAQFSEHHVVVFRPFGAYRGLGP